jgi:hypothetical protein
MAPSPASAVFSGVNPFMGNLIKRSQSDSTSAGSAPIEEARLVSRTPAGIASIDDSSGA